MNGYQPFSGATPRQEYEAAKTMIQLARQNPDNLTTRFYIYANWDSQPPVGTTFRDRWFDPTPTDPDAGLIRNANGFNWIYDQLVMDPDLAGVELLMIPVGDVLAEIDLRMSLGQISGFTGADELYRDILHLNNLGRFVAANTFLSTLFKLDPTGTPTNSDFDTIPIQPFPITITPELATAVQRAVWDVVSTHPLSGVIQGDLNGDGFVGIADLNIVLGNWNLNVSPGSWLLGDPSDDGFVGIADLNVVLGNWNADSLPPSLSVPEPSTGTVLLSLGIGWGVARRYTDTERSLGNRR